MYMKSGLSGSPILELVDGEYLLRGIHSVNASKSEVPHMSGVLVDLSMLSSLGELLT